jgi:hypothetical protein
MARADAVLGGREIDRMAVRFEAPETGGAASPRFISARVLAFEARLEALEQQEPIPPPPSAYPDRVVRPALERHVAEEILAALTVARGVEPPGFERQIALARTSVIERVGGADALAAAMKTEGIAEPELRDILARRVRASYYVDHAISRILHPSEDELREAYRTAQTTFTRDKKFEEVRGAVERWLVVERMRAAESAFFQSARARVTIAYPE